jgi:hypothetical protein
VLVVAGAGAGAGPGPGPGARVAAPAAAEFELEAAAPEVFEAEAALFFEAAASEPTVVGDVRFSSSSEPSDAKILKQHKTRSGTVQCRRYLACAWPTYCAASFKTNKLSRPMEAVSAGAVRSTALGARNLDARGRRCAAPGRGTADGDKPAGERRR